VWVCHSKDKEHLLKTLEREKERERANARAHTHTHTHNREGLDSKNTAGVTNRGVLIFVVAPPSLPTHKRCKSDWATSTWYTLGNANAGGTVTFKSYNLESTS